MDIDASLEVWLFFEHIMNNSLGINNNSNSANFIHPNPAKNFFSISSSRAYLKYEIYDITGDKVLAGDNRASIDISILSSGIYFVKIQENNSISIKKLIVK